MKYLVLGADGFIGKNVVKQLSLKKDNIIFTAKRNSSDKNNYNVDLLDKKSIINALKKVKPEIIINCAGFIANNEEAVLKNPIFTLNLLQSVITSKINSVNKIIILGSAAEYGEIQGDIKSVKEDEHLMAESFYGISKILEVSTALRFREEYNLPIIIARLFNPIGYVKNTRQLIPRILGQIEEIKQGKRNYIEVSRLDSERDYIGVEEAAKIIVMISEKLMNNHSCYNIGSGKSTSNKEIIDKIIKVYGLRGIKIKETSDVPEPQYAAEANIQRLVKEYNWKPEVGLEEIIQEIIRETVYEEGKSTKKL